MGLVWIRRRWSGSVRAQVFPLTETTRILIAQLVLHFLPPPHFSLLVYILTFFSQVAMVHEKNGLGMEALAHMFGGWIFGGGQSRRRKFSAEIAMEDPHQPRMEGEVMMCWFRPVTGRHMRCAKKEPLDMVFPPIEWVSTKGKRRKKGRKREKEGNSSGIKPHLHQINSNCRLHAR